MKTSLVKIILVKTVVKASLKSSLSLGKTETQSEKAKYDDKKSMTWIGVWILLSITSWKVYLQEQEKYLWQVREFDSRIQDAKLIVSVITRKRLQDRWQEKLVGTRRDS